MRILLLHIVHADATCDLMLQQHRRIDVENRFPHISRYFVRFRPNERSQRVVEEGDMLFVHGNESGILGITEKTLQALRYVLIDKEESYDFVIRSNASTLFHFDRLTAFLATIPTQQVYTGSPCYTIPDYNFLAGVYNPSYIGMRYAQGTCILWSYDQSLLLVQRQDWVSREVVDDVSFADFFRQYNPAAYARVGSPELRFHLMTPENMAPETLLQTAGDAIVFRNKAMWWVTNRTKDLENMEKLVDCLYCC